MYKYIYSCIVTSRQSDDVHTVEQKRDGQLCSVSCRQDVVQKFVIDQRMSKASHCLSLRHKELASNASEKVYSTYGQYIRVSRYYSIGSISTIV